MESLLLIEFDGENVAGIVVSEARLRFHLSSDILQAKMPPIKRKGPQLDGEDALEEVMRLRALLRKDIALGITGYDMYVPGLNFVFGLASKKGKAALVTTYRLKSDEPGLFETRLVKEVVHELGHVSGLNHCPDVRCVMHFSNSLVDTDVKEKEFCNKCKQRLFMR